MYNTLSQQIVLHKIETDSINCPLVKVIEFTFSLRVGRSILSGTKRTL